jgi:ADP-ribosylglycohydrolase
VSIDDERPWYIGAVDALADHDLRMRRARLALEGLSVGGAFAARASERPGPVDALLAARILPPSPWPRTGDSELARSILEVLDSHRDIDREALARAFGERYRGDPTRPYDDALHWTLASISGGLAFEEAAESALSLGEIGPAAAARVVPVGAYFSDDLDRAASAARASAEVTDARPDGQAGAVAVAVAAAIAAQMGDRQLPKQGSSLIEGALALTPEGPVARGLSRARALLSEPPRDRTAGLAALQVLSSWPVPFGLYCAARSLDDFADAMWSSALADTNREAVCAIAGGLVALAGGAGALPYGTIPVEWVSAREPLLD